MTNFRQWMLLACAAAVVPTMALSQSQEINTPQQSPKATVSQTVGMTEMEVVYHRPGVKGRTIWGELVPYDGGKPMPWRGGANENTTFSATDDLLVEGKPLPAGVYGLHMIPSANEWTIIFSRNHTSWGSFFYKQDEDALRVTVKPVSAEFQEWLSYSFEDLSDFEATVALRWENLKVPIRVEVADGYNTVLASFRKELRSLPGFFPAGHITAARYCLQHDINHEEAIAWADRAIALGGGFNARIVKADLLAQSGNGAGGEEIRKSAIEQSSENELNNYGYQLINEGKISQAVEIFTLNVKRHPDSWNVYDSLGEGYEKKGDEEMATKSYRMALEKNPPEAQVERIHKVLERLE